MMITSKQRAHLRALANHEDTILHIGKEGIIDTLRRQADDALTARELIKAKVLETAPGSAREMGETLAGLVGAELVQVIGARFVLYRADPKTPRIILP